MYVEKDLNTNKKFMVVYYEVHIKGGGGTFWSLAVSHTVIELSAVYPNLTVQLGVLTQDITWMLLCEFKTFLIWILFQHVFEEKG